MAPRRLSPDTEVPPVISQVTEDFPVIPDWVSQVTDMSSSQAVHRGLLAYADCDPPMNFAAPGTCVPMANDESRFDYIIVTRFEDDDCITPWMVQQALFNMRIHMIKNDVLHIAFTPILDLDNDDYFEILKYVFRRQWYSTITLYTGALRF